MTFGRVLIWGAVQSVIRLAAGLATTKVLSVYLGPSGLALFAQFQTFTGLVNNFANGGIQQGIVKYTAELKNDQLALRRLNRTIAFLALVFPALLAVPMLVWHAQLAAWLFKSSELEIAVVVYACLLIFTSIATTLGAQLSGLYRPIRYFVIQSAFALLSLGLAVVLTASYGLLGALLSIPLAFVGLAFVAVACGRGLPEIRLADWLPRVDTQTAKGLLSFAALLLVTGICIAGSQLYVRNLLFDAQSADVAGHWQAVLRVSEPLVIIVTSVLTSYYLPKLSGASRAARRDLLRHYFRLVFPAFAAVALFFIALREQLILLMFTPAFLPAAELFAPQLLGDTLRMTGWIANIALMAMGRTGAVMISEMVYAFSFVAGSTLLIPTHGAWAASISYLIAMGLASLTLWIAMLSDKSQSLAHTGSSRLHP